MFDVLFGIIKRRWDEQHFERDDFCVFVRFLIYNDDQGIHPHRRSGVVASGADNPSSRLRILCRDHSQQSHY